MLTLSLVVMLAQTGDVPQRPPRTDRVPRGGGRGAAVAPPFFEFAPTSGAGMGTACACTTPTGSKGEVMTYTRASNGTCTKTATGGLVTTGIANGDLVVCSTNQPRVEYDASGTLGLLVEGTRTNSTLRSQELENVVWASNNSGIALPTVTANATTAPDGTVTADRLQIPGSTTAGHYSQLFQLNSCPSGAAAQIASVYLRGVSGSGSVCLKIGTNVATCNYVSGSWSRCTPSINAAASTTLALSVDVTACGANATGVDVYVWGVQCENSGAYVTSYIPTTSAGVTRAAATASLAFSAFSGGGSMAGNLYMPSPLVANGANLMVAPAINGTPSMLGYFNSAFTCYTPTRAPTSINQGGFVSGSRASCWLDATTSGIQVDGVGSTSNSGTWPSAGVVQLGANSTAPTSMNGIHSRVCVSPITTGCR